MSFNKLSCRLKKKGKNTNNPNLNKKGLDNKKDSKKIGRIEEKNGRVSEMRGDKLGPIIWDLGNENQNIS